MLLFFFQEVTTVNCLQKKKTEATGAQHSLSKSQVSNTSLSGYLVTENHSIVAPVPDLKYTCFS